MSLGTIRMLYAHHGWANRLLLDVAAKLGEDAVAREIGRQFSEHAGEWLAARDRAGTLHRHPQWSGSGMSEQRRSAR